MSPYTHYLSTARRFARLVGLSDAAVPTVDVPDEGLFVRETPTTLELCFTERGRVRVDCAGTADDLVFHVLAGLTGGQARAHELRHRRLGEDSRRQWMADHVRRLADLDPAWADRQRADYDVVLAVHPFDDALARRSERWDELMAGGMSRADAVAQAEREIPDVAASAEDRRLPR